ncbi:MAG: class I SAM-dependent methyltransferase [Bacteroidota bacterium]|nr:class I SAM-dependent methyltransferase [Bacteroidota bacterium]
MNCNICQSQFEPIFKKIILGKYTVQFYQCTHCGFVQTEKPYWLAEAYTDAISVLDTGILERNFKFSIVFPWVVKFNFNKKGRFLDYGGGYGIFVRLMRDKGFDFYRQDAFCENLFAKMYDLKDINSKDQKFEMLTAFEVFEHLTDPVNEVMEMLKYSDSILFSTLLIPSKSNDLSNWWYISEQTGQHVSFYSEKSLKILGEKFEMNLYSNGDNFHLLTKRKINPIFFIGLKGMYFIKNMFKSTDKILLNQNADRQKML